MLQNLVSVIIPTYKRADRLQDAIDSVLNQTYNNIEVIVVDDNNDGDAYRLETIKIMDRFKPNPKVKYIKHSVNSNGSAARNTGYKASIGNYICFMDDDDCFYPQKVEIQLAHLIANDLDASCVGFEFYNDKVIYKRATYENCTKNNVYDLLSGNIIFAAGSTLMITENAFKNLGGFDTSFVRHQDWEFLMRLFRDYKFGICNEFLVGINTDGIRNYPNPIKFQETKEKFLSEFKSDIMQLSSSERKKVLSYQWSEVMVYFFRDRKILKGLNLYINKIVFENHNLQIKQLLKAFYYFFENYSQWLKRAKYLLLKKR